jgi:hypothetical protein
MWNLATVERSPRRNRQLAIRYHLVAAKGPNIQHRVMKEVGCSKELGGYVSLSVCTMCRVRERRATYRSTVYRSHHMRRRSSRCSSVKSPGLLGPFGWPRCMCSISSSPCASSSLGSGGGVTGTSLPSLSSLASDQAAFHQRSDAALYSLAEMTMAKCIYVATSSRPPGAPASK